MIGATFFAIDEGRCSGPPNEPGCLQLARDSVPSNQKRQPQEHGFHPKENDTV